MAAETIYDDPWTETQDGDAIAWGDLLEMELPPERPLIEGLIEEDTGQTKKRFLGRAGSAYTATEIAKTLYKIPALLTIWTRCSKPTCRCNTGQLHGPYHALHWRDGTIQRRRYVRAGDVPAVRAILEQRRQARAAERLALGLSLRSWRQLARLVEEYEARIREEGGRS
jgi:hypothetical protein